MSQKKFAAAINDALHQAMEIDSSVICYGLGVTDQRRQKQQTVGDVFGFFGEMFADEGIVKAQLVGKNNRLAVFRQSVRATPLFGVHGHGEIA